MLELLQVLLLLPLAGRRGRGVGRLGSGPAGLLRISDSGMDERRRQVARDRCGEWKKVDDSTMCESSEGGILLPQASMVYQYDLSDLFELRLPPKVSVLTSTYRVLCLL